jgi:hypothetical protein
MLDCATAAEVSMPVETSQPTSDEVYLTAEELADRWRVDTGALANLRSRGDGLPFTKPSGRVLYALSHVLAVEMQEQKGFSWARLETALKECLKLKPGDHAKLMAELRLKLK